MCPDLPSLLTPLGEINPCTLAHKPSKTAQHREEFALFTPIRAESKGNNRRQEARNTASGYCLDLVLLRKMGEVSLGQTILASAPLAYVIISSGKQKNESTCSALVGTQEPRKNQMCLAVNDLKGTTVPATSSKKQKRENINKAKLRYN